MNTNNFDEIIDFAIEREKEAISFYQNLKNMARFSEKKKMLSELESMEKSHINMLNSIRKNSVHTLDIPHIQDLHVSDFLVDAKTSHQMTYQDILITAIKKEEKSVNLYQKMAHSSSNPDAQKAFLKLASEEKKHKLMFENIYDDEILSQD